MANSRSTSSCVWPTVRKFSVAEEKYPLAAKCARNTETTEFLACDVVLSDWMTKCLGIGRPVFCEIESTWSNARHNASQKADAPWDKNSSAVYMQVHQP